MVSVNGQMKDIDGSNLYQYLLNEGFELSRVVVEYNLNIIPSNELAEIVVKDGDVVEVLRFVGGG